MLSTELHIQREVGYIMIRNVTFYVIVALHLFALVAIWFC